MKNKNIIIGVLLVSLIGIGVFGYQQRQETTSYRTRLENNYQYDFQSLLSTVKNIETNMSKAIVSTSHSMSVELLTEVWRQADLAQTYLGRLPLTHSTLKDTAKFLNQVGDFSYAMAKIHMDSGTLTKEQRNDFQRLNNSCSYLSQQLQEMNESVTSGEITFAEGSRESNEGNLDEAAENLVMRNFTTVQKEMEDYPKLIYDGPFSDHISEIEPKWIEGEKITIEEGQKKAIEFIGSENVEEVENSGNIEGVIKAYKYNIKIKDQEESAYVEITQKGGHVLKAMMNRLPHEQKLSMEEAQKKADEFLKEKGYKNMENSYYQKYSNVGVFNYAYTEGDVLCYPDLIKVQIALDNGGFLGIEAQGFHYAHHERKIEKPVITMEQAKENLIEDFELTSERLAIIPTDFKSEVLCYELKGTYNYKWFIIYINAKTGEEEQILQIIEADESVLTL